MFPKPLGSQKIIQMTLSWLLFKGNGFSLIYNYIVSFLILNWIPDLDSCVKRNQTLICLILIDSKADFALKSFL